MKSENRAIELAQKAIGMIEAHENSSGNHVLTAKKLKDGYDIFKLPAGNFYGRNLKNAPQNIGGEYVYINVEAIDGRLKKYRVWNSQRGLEYTAFGGWREGVNMPPRWHMPIIGQDLDLAEGVSGTAKQNIFWIDNNHTQIDIEFDVELNYPGNNLPVHLARQNPAGNYVKGKNLFFASVLTSENSTHSPCIISWTQYGWITLVSEKPGKYFRGYFSVTLEPDGPNWKDNKRAPWA